jgi:aminoglycoside phosphotransferase (APT) family kinase protein
VRGLDEERVGPWLAENVVGAAPPFSYSLIAGGHSNLTFRVAGADGQRFVLRRPPLGHVLATAHDVAREHRIISALGPTSVPVPPALALCTDERVNDAPFYVMGYVDGVVLDGVRSAEALTPPHRRVAGFDLIDVLADLHLVDVEAVGLGDLGRHTGYLERQLRRWSTQWEASKTRELSAIEEVHALLSKAVPAQHAVAVAHGDYRFGNCLLDPATGRIAAVLDWELCTLGDPLADVAYQAVYWTDPGDRPRMENDPTAAPGFPTYGEVLERYAARTGFDVSDIDYYIAFAHWRLAIITEGVYVRYLHGAMGDEASDLDVLAARIDRLAGIALASAQGLVA